MRLRGYVAVWLVLIGGILATLPSTALAGGWLALAATQPGSREVDSEDMELDAQGNATAAWVEYQPWRVIKAATRPRGGVWSQPVTLSDPTEEGAWNPQVAVGANGDAVVVWSSNYHPPAHTQTVFAVTHEAGGGWSPPVKISKQGGLELTYEPQVVVDAHGNATAIWSEQDEPLETIETSTRPKGGQWGPPVAVIASEELVGRSPELAVDSAGEVTAVWTWGSWEYLGGVVQSATRPYGGDWSSPVDLSDTRGKATLPRLAVDPQGDTVAVWKSNLGEGAVQAASRTANGSWGPAVDLSGEKELYDPDVAIDPQGTATAVWETYDGVGDLVHASTSALGGSWSVPLDISERDESEGFKANPQVVVDSQGDVTAAWRTYHDFGINMIQAARRDAGGDWSRPVDVGRSNGALEDFPLAVDPQGYVTAGWSRGMSVYSSVFDSVPPELDSLEVPATGVVGQPVTMSVDPFDVWPPVATRWEFGDGASGSGATVTHCYSTPGERAITVTGTDGAANTTSTSQTIAIEPNPALGSSDPCASSVSPPQESASPEEASPEKTATEKLVLLDSPAVSPEPEGHTDPGFDLSPPVVSRLQQSNSRWRTRGARRASRLPFGTTFRFTLDRAAQVRLVFFKIASGRREGGRCVKVTRANAKKLRCDLSQRRGTLQMAGKAGANAFSFAGKIRNRMFGPGLYRLQVTAVAGEKRSTAVSIHFTIAH